MNLNLNLNSIILLVVNLFTNALMQQVGATSASISWSANFSASHLEVHMQTEFDVLVTIWSEDVNYSNYLYKVKSTNPELAFVNHTFNFDETVSNNNRSNNVSVDALFLGTAEIYVERFTLVNNASEKSNQTLKLIITRKERIIDHVFTGSVILFVSLLYINFGAALDLNVLRTLITKPIGPAIGFITQFVIMPLLSYGLGYLIFPNNPELRLGLFITGVSPSGGASNIWSVLLGGNIHLSVLMTTISNLAAFIMMPSWLFTLGSTLFKQSLSVNPKAEANLVKTYTRIAYLVVGLIVPIGIGLAIQRVSQRLTRLLVNSLKPISTCLLLFIIVFAIITNLYLFQLFTWQIIVAGLGLPWLGYMMAWMTARILRQNKMDALTIAIETGIQNTGISILLLRLVLDAPQDDLTTVIPVAVAIMTPLPLLGIYLYKRFASGGIKDGIMEEPLNGRQEHIH